MNALQLRACLALLGLCLAFPSLAHDPKEHEKEAAAAKAGPDCEKLKTMDMSTMDPNDPVLKALQAKCAKANAAAGADHHDHEHAKDEKKIPAPSDAAGGH